MKQTESPTWQRRNRDDEAEKSDKKDRESDDREK